MIADESSLRAAPEVDRVAVKPRLLFFYAPQEGASRRTESYLSQVLQRRRNHHTFHVHRIDVTARPDLAARFRVTETPAFLVIADGKIKTRLARPKGTTHLREHLAPWLR